jgi:hypothetical protein
VGPVELLTDALSHGGKVLWDPPERPKLILPKGVRERLEPGREVVREILQRAATFREQANQFIRRGHLLPLLALPNRRHGDGCISCGDPLNGTRYRCEVCPLAVKLALEEIP